MYLAGAVGSTATDTGNTGYGTTGTPRLCGCLVASLFADGIGLALVLCDALCQGMSGGVIWQERD